MLGRQNGVRRRRAPSGRKRSVSLCGGRIEWRSAGDANPKMKGIAMSLRIMFGERMAKNIN